MSTTAANGTDDLFDMTDPGFLSDPHGTAARLRERGPAVPARFLDGTRVVVFTRDADVRTILSDPRFVVSPESVPDRASATDRAQVMRSLGLAPDLVAYLTESLLDHDGSDHARLRKLVSRTFTVRRVNELRPRVEEIAEDLLSALPGHAEDGTVDLLEHYAYPLPITVICELVGVPEPDRARWREWSAVLARFDPSDASAANTVLGQMIAHIKDLIARCRTEPGQDLLSALVRVRDEDGGRLSEAELITMVFTLVIAGHETTAHLLGNGVAALLAHPGQLAALRADPALAPAAVHEMQRWCGPVVITRLRYAAEEVELGGRTLAPGTPVQPLLVGANRDPGVFADPDRFDITRHHGRPGEAHVGFGHGIHYCLGAALARQECEVALLALLRRYPDLAPAVDPGRLERQPTTGAWRLLRLPVRLG